MQIYARQAFALSPCVNYPGLKRLSRKLIADKIR